MRLVLDLKKSMDQNASVYYEKSKKAKRKLKGASETIEKTQKELNKLLKTHEVAEKNRVVKVDRKKEWFEKFRWFYTSNGLLVIGGRDATTNEIVIKKHTDKEDIVFHTDMAGSPFFVLKTEGKKVDQKILKEVADATCTFSRAWKLGIQSQDVFYVNPEQVSKKQESGTTHLAKGAFMIYGKTNYMENKVNACVGMKDGMIMCGPCESVKKHCKEIIQVIQGKEKASVVAKKIKAKLGGELDEIIRVLPSGSFEIKK